MTALAYTVVSGATNIAAGATTGTTIQAAYTALVAALPFGTLVAAFYDGESQRGRNFVPSLGASASQWNGAGTSNPPYLYGSGTAAAVVFPSVVSVTLATATDAVNTSTGQVKLVLAPGTGDLFNASSVMTYYLDPGVTVITVNTGTY